MKERREEGRGRGGKEKLSSGTIPGTTSVSVRVLVVDSNDTGIST